MLCFLLQFFEKLHKDCHVTKKWLVPLENIFTPGAIVISSLTKDSAFVVKIFASYKITLNRYLTF